MQWSVSTAHCVVTMGASPFYETALNCNYKETKQKKGIVRTTEKKIYTSNVITFVPTDHSGQH